MSTINSNSCFDFSYWFSSTIQDNNGNTVTDINEGINKLIPDMIEELNDTTNQHTRFIVPDCQEAMPDISAQKFYNYENLWWYLCLSNVITNPFNEYNRQFLYYAFTLQILVAHDVSINNAKKDNKSKIGTIIELN